jgi:hypothetical protein
VDIAKFLSAVQKQKGPLAEDILEISKSERTKRDERTSGVCRQIENDWREGWELFDAVVFSAQQSGLLLGRRSSEIADEYSAVRLALLALHATAVSTVQEIGVLLRAGFWAGAAGRWRSLHELAVTSRIIAEYGPHIAQRYLDHGFVVQTRRLVEFYAQHGRAPVNPDELRRRQAEADRLVITHASNEVRGPFHMEYGWAAILMPHGRKHPSGRIRPTFVELEKLADATEDRLLVTSAHGVVHVDSAGVMAVAFTDEGMVLGPTPAHVATVARPTLRSMSVIMDSSILGSEPVLDDHAAVMGLNAAATAELAMRAIQAFTSDEDRDEPVTPDT